MVSQQPDVHMDNGHGRPWCNPSMLRVVGSEGSVLGAIITDNPLACTCSRCAPRAQEQRAKVEELLAAVVNNNHVGPYDDAIRLLLELVKGGDPDQVREDAGAYLDGLDPCYCPCQGDGDDPGPWHLPTCDWYNTPGPPGLGHAF